MNKTKKGRHVYHVSITEHFFFLLFFLSSFEDASFECFCIFLHILFVFGIFSFNKIRLEKNETEL